MPAKNIRRNIAIGGYFHIYNKGFDGRNIFNDDQDYQMFVEYLKEYLSSPTHPDNTKTTFIVKGKTYQGVPHLPKNYFGKVELAAYCLKPNHFHLVLRQLDESSLERLLRSLTTRYSMYFNKKYKRSGSLFAGVYKSMHIESQDELATLIGFLHYKEGEHSTASQYGDSILVKAIQKPIDPYRNEESQNKIIERLNFETIAEHFGHDISTNNIVIRKEETKRQYTKIKHNYRLPELILSSGVFVILLFLGIKNVQTYNLTTLASDKVLGITATLLPTPTPTPTSSPIMNPLPTATASPTLNSIENLIAGTESAKVKPVEAPQYKTLTVVITDGSPTVNIRISPNLTSGVVEKATNGETFEYISMDNIGWYRVVLSDGTGYISTKYVKVQ